MYFADIISRIGE